MRFTTDDVRKKIETATNYNFTLIGNYYGSHKKIRVKHSFCGSIQEVRYSHFLERMTCRACNSKKKRKSNDTFLKEVRSLVGDEYTFLEEYSANSTAIEIVHNVCNYSYKVRPSNFLSGTRCPRCTNSTPINTTLFREKVYKAVGDEFKILDEYVNSSTKIRMVHINCNNIISLTPASFIAGVRCKYCNGGVKNRDTVSCRDEVAKLTNNEYEILGEYVNARTKTLTRHHKCSHDYYVAPDDFINSNRRCPRCAKNASIDTDEFKRRVFSKYSGEYEVLGEYIKNSVKIEMHHVSCGFKYEVHPRDFLSGRKCPACFKNYKKTTAIFKKELFDIYGDEYTVLGKYTGANNKVKIRHEDCGRTINPTPSNMLRGNSHCSACKDSLGSLAVQSYLNERGYSFQKEYTFDDCKRIHRLRFDFALIDYNNNLICLIEYDGIQHFEPAFTKEAFRLTQESDRIKEAYCKKNNIHLIRISYRELDIIDEILDDELEIYRKEKILLAV